jgi:hypothetical protein
VTIPEPTVRVVLASLRDDPSCDTLPALTERLELEAADVEAALETLLLRGVAQRLGDRWRLTERG